MTLDASATTQSCRPRLGRFSGTVQDDKLPDASYAMVERRQLPGVVRIRRRVLFRTEALLDWVHQKSAPLPKE
jgi:hypothetical protein